LAQGQYLGLGQEQDPGVILNQAKSRWVNTFTRLAEAISDTLYNVVENSAAAVLQNVEYQILGDLGENPSQGTILDKLQSSQLIIGQMTKDPEVQEAIKGLAEEVAILSIQMLDTVKPTVDRITDKALESLNNVADKATKGLINTGLNIVEAILGEIPVAGGVIALIVAFVRGFNTAMLAAAPGVEFSAESFFTAIITALNMVQLFSVEQAKIIKKVETVKNSIDNLAPMAILNPSRETLQAFEQKGQAYGQQISQAGADIVTRRITKPRLPTTNLPPPAPAAAVNLPPPNATKQMGGANIRNRIKQVTQRLKHTLHRFLNINRHRQKVHAQIKKQTRRQRK
jgi:hypothetical protein